ncbi:hypothetical protein HZB78_04865 [Candidatus Collierbacteria bacterium]|nr:hypothetical protein [Candidatus Collierbacteria bacterium]
MLSLILLNNNAMTIKTKDQFDRLATLCFDLAKVWFTASALSPLGLPLTAVVITGIKGIVMGIAFVYVGLILLQMKSEVSQ